MFSSIASSSLWSWLTFGSSLVSPAKAGLAAHQSSVPSAAANSSALNPATELEVVMSTDLYTEWTVSAIEVLQEWYDEDEGLWLSTNWWNSANCLTVLGDFLAVIGNREKDLNLDHVFSNTFSQAQKTAKFTSKMPMTRPSGLRTIESPHGQDSKPKLAKRGYRGFLDGYYDDEGWWALAWIRAYDVFGNAEYLSMAERIFQDMKGGLANSTCGGGIWWDKDRSYKNAIANELYLSVAASLANRATHSEAYLATAEGQWAWFQRSGLINNRNLINDGLRIYDNGTCVNNERNTWSYNQGVILGGLLELHRATGNSSLLSTAADIAEAAISALSIDGVLHESCENEDCGADGSQFKGVFVRNLQYLQLEINRPDFRRFILANANSIWNNDRNVSGYLGLNWAGPPSAGGSPNASTHSSALDALVAAMAIF
ncbi:hypothetical protein N0V93_007372 [Gnomoniopsis smithogilvyi]|uniref:Glycosyl hydrolase n=1 Tax=Gnomoniopsis smithogilvyi TaxID=1191159 RepID=A0A9W9CWJ3_9PEZI|nr:hypothetical protein N0V93_007372 [Gnomoniopsis smithogilvyi]